MGMIGVSSTRTIRSTGARSACASSSPNGQARKLISSRLILPTEARAGKSTGSQRTVDNDLNRRSRRIPCEDAAPTALRIPAGEPHEPDRRSKIAREVAKECDLGELSRLDARCVRFLLD